MAKYFAIVCLFMYLFRWVIFVVYNVEMHSFYPLYFYILEILWLGFWMLVMFYTVWPFFFQGPCEFVLWMGILFAFLNVVFRYLTDRAIFVDNDCEGDESWGKCVTYWTAVVLSVIFAIALDISFITLYACRKCYPDKTRWWQVRSVQENFLENQNP